MMQHYIAVELGDSWAVEDTLVQRTVINSENQAESEAKTMAKLMSSESALGGTVVVDADGHAKLGD